jgi:hypothetical protein
MYCDAVNSFLSPVVEGKEVQITRIMDNPVIWKYMYPYCNLENNVILA